MLWTFLIRREKTFQDVRSSAISSIRTSRRSSSKWRSNSCYGESSSSRWVNSPSFFHSSVVGGGTSLHSSTSFSSTTGRKKLDEGKGKGAHNQDYVFPLHRTLRWIHHGKTFYLSGDAAGGMHRDERVENLARTAFPSPLLRAAHFPHLGVRVPQEGEENNIEEQKDASRFVKYHAHRLLVVWKQQSREWNDQRRISHLYNKNSVDRRRNRQGEGVEKVSPPLSNEISEKEEGVIEMVKELKNEVGGKERSQEGGRKNSCVTFGLSSSFAFLSAEQQGEVVALLYHASLLFHLSALYEVAEDHVERLLSVLLSATIFLSQAAVSLVQCMNTPRPIPHFRDAEEEKRKKWKSSMRSSVAARSGKEYEGIDTLASKQDEKKEERGWARRSLPPSSSISPSGYWWSSSLRAAISHYCAGVKLWELIDHQSSLLFGVNVPRPPPSTSSCSSATTSPLHCSSSSLPFSSSSCSSPTQSFSSVYSASSSLRSKEHLHHAHQNDHCDAHGDKQKDFFLRYAHGIPFLCILKSTCTLLSNILQSKFHSTRITGARERRGLNGAGKDIAELLHEEEEWGREYSYQHQQQQCHSFLPYYYPCYHYPHYHHPSTSSCSSSSYFYFLLRLLRRHDHDVKGTSLALSWFGDFKASHCSTPSTAPPPLQKEEVIRTEKVGKATTEAAGIITRDEETQQEEEAWSNSLISTTPSFPPLEKSGQLCDSKHVWGSAVQDPPPPLSLPPTPNDALQFSDSIVNWPSPLDRGERRVLPLGSAPPPHDHHQEGEEEERLRLLLRSGVQLRQLQLLPIFWLSLLCAAPCFTSSSLPSAGPSFSPPSARTGRRQKTSFTTIGRGGHDHSPDDDDVRISWVSLRAAYGEILSVLYHRNAKLEVLSLSLLHILFDSDGKRDGKSMAQMRTSPSCAPPPALLLEMSNIIGVMERQGLLIIPSLRLFETALQSCPPHSCGDEKPQCLPSSITTTSFSSVSPPAEEESVERDSTSKYVEEYFLGWLLDWKMRCVWEEHTLLTSSTSSTSTREEEEEDWWGRMTNQHTADEAGEPEERAATGKKDEKMDPRHPPSKDGSDNSPLDIASSSFSSFSFSSSSLSMPPLSGDNSRPPYPYFPAAHGHVPLMEGYHADGEHFVNTIHARRLQPALGIYRGEQYVALTHIPLSLLCWVFPFMRGKTIVTTTKARDSITIRKEAEEEKRASDQAAHIWPSFSSTFSSSHYTGRLPPPPRQRVCFSVEMVALTCQVLRTCVLRVLLQWQPPSLDNPLFPSFSPSPFPSLNAHAFPSSPFYSCGQENKEEGGSLSSMLRRSANFQEELVLLLEAAQHLHQLWWFTFHGREQIKRSIIMTMRTTMKSKTITTINNTNTKEDEDGKNVLPFFLLFRGYSVAGGSSCALPCKVGKPTFPPPPLASSSSLVAVQQGQRETKKEEEDGKTLDCSTSKRQNEGNLSPFLRLHPPPHYKKEALRVVEATTMSTLSILASAMRTLAMQVAGILDAYITTTHKTAVVNDGVVPVAHPPLEKRKSFSSCSSAVDVPCTLHDIGSCLSSTDWTVLELFHVYVCDVLSRDAVLEEAGKDEEGYPNSSASFSSSSFSSFSSDFSCESPHMNDANNKGRGEVARSGKGGVPLGEVINMQKGDAIVEECRHFRVLPLIYVEVVLPLLEWKRKEMGR